MTRRRRTVRDPGRTWRVGELKWTIIVTAACDAECCGQPQLHASQGEVRTCARAGFDGALHEGLIDARVEAPQALLVSWTGCEAFVWLLVLRLAIFEGTWATSSDWTRGCEIV